MHAVHAGHRDGWRPPCTHSSTHTHIHPSTRDKIRNKTRVCVASYGEITGGPEATRAPPYGVGAPQNFPFVAKFGDAVTVCCDRERGGGVAARQVAALETCANQDTERTLNTDLLPQTHASAQ